jgi:hypothetical protein
MPQFSPDQVTFGDTAGYGLWDMNHAREHLQFLQVLAGKTPAMLLPAFDLFAFLTAGQARRRMVESHYEAHQLLRQATNVQGVDLSQVDLNDQSGFYDWLGYHAQEHAQIRSVLGMT